MSTPKAHPEVVAELAPNRTLRAGINLSNFLLVSGKADNGDPIGVSPDMAAEIAHHLGVELALITYPGPGALADAAEHDEWDIGNIGAEPQRARTISFTPAYCEIESTYLVPAGSPFQSVSEVDQPGVRIAVKGRAAYGLWLENNLKHAELIRTDSIDDSFTAFVDQKLDALAGLRPRLISDVKQLPDARILEDRFSSVQQAVGTPRKNTAAAFWLAELVEYLKQSGFVGDLIERHKVKGLSVAPPADAKV
ncbi:MAG: transporter substrate-binding domain-containing protein [Rhizobiaceae bacterium]